MVEKIPVRPESVRGLGNIISPSKTLEDFSVYKSSLSFEDSFYTMEAMWFTDIVLTADDSILSYSNGDSTTLRAQLMDGTSTASVSGVTVEFFNGSTSLGTAQTDSNGVATKTYTSTGAGDISLTASDGTLSSEPYDIEDCNFFDPSSSSNVSKYSVGNGASFSYDSTNTGYSIYPSSSGSRFVTLNNETFNKDNKVSIDFKLTSVPDNGQCGFVFGNVGVRAIIVPNSSIRRITISDASLNTDYSLFEYSSLALNTWYTLELLPTGVLNLKQNDAIVATCNYDISSLLTDNNQFKLFVAYNYQTRTHVKNIKIKPL